MANDLNQCNFIGRLAADPEMRYMPSGDSVCNFRIAVGWKSKEKEGAEWLSVAAFGKLGEICGEFLKKGSQVFVSCRAKVDEYEKNGEKRYSTKFIAEKMQMVGGRCQGKGESAVEPTERKRGNSEDGGASDRRPAQSGGGFEDMEDDIPF